MPIRRIPVFNRIDWNYDEFEQIDWGVDELEVDDFTEDDEEEEVDSPISSDAEDAMMHIDGDDDFTTSENDPSEVLSRIDMEPGAQEPLSYMDLLSVSETEIFRPIDNYVFWQIFLNIPRVMSIDAYFIRLVTEWTPLSVLQADSN